MAQALAGEAIRKASRRLIPFLCLAYGVNFLDRVNVGFAALAMNEDLGFTPEVFGFGAGIFFVGYILFEVPSNLALHRFGARIWIARIMISWGIVATAMALIVGEMSFYALRFLLGVAEAGFFPGIILYLTYWFPREERARIVSLFMTAVPIATVIGGPVSGALLGLHGLGGMAGWRWLFVIEGLPAILLGLLALKMLPDRPSHASWLSRDEAEALEARLDAEAQATRLHGYAGLGQALTNPRVLLLGVTYFCLVIGLYGIGFWMPQVIKAFGLSNLEVGLLAAIPYLIAAIGMALAGRHSDKTGERIWHVAIPLFLGAIAFVWSALAGPLPLVMLALSLAALGIHAALGTFWSLPSAILTGVGAAGGLALVNSIGNCGGFVGPLVVGWLKGATGTFTLALVFLAGALLLSGLLALAFGRVARTSLGAGEQIKA
jgi:ACS family tartrate transporter-like MFS transporter